MKGRNFHNGFSLVEIMVISPIIILMIGAFIVAIVTLTGEALASRTQSTLIYTLGDSLARIRSDVRISEGFLAINSFTPAAPQGAGDDTTHFKNVTSTSGSQGLTALILRLPATTSAPDASNTAFVFLTPTRVDCTSQTALISSRMMTNVVYFIRDNTLWRRVLLPSDYISSGCAMPWQRPTCTEGFSASFCVTNDEKLVSGIAPEDFNVQYFSSSAVTSPIAEVSDPAVSDAQRDGGLSGSTNVKVSITAKQLVFGRTIEQTSSMRTSRSIGRAN